MSLITNSKEKFIDTISKAFHQFEISLNGSKSLPVHEIRKSGFENFIKKGVPTIKNEEWKYTSLESVLKFNYTPSNLLKTDVELYDINIISPFIISNLACHRIVFINGKIIEHLCDLKSEDSGLELDRIHNIIKSNDDRYKYVNELSKSSNESLVDLNNSFLEVGLFLRIKKNNELKYPVHIINVTDRSTSSPLTFYRNVMVAEENSKATVFCSQHSIGANASMVNAVVEIYVENNAKLDYIKLQDLHPDNQQEIQSSSLIENTFVKLHRDSLFNVYTVSVSGDLIRNTLNVLLSDKNGEAHLYGLYMPTGTEVIDNHTLVDHAVPNCYSNELYKGIMADKSKGVFNGKIMVRKDAQKTNAFQSNKNILLTNEATINTKPQLEIFADDVKCSHGATSGQLDETSLFYLKARGIGAEKAQAMLMLAFAEQTIEKISIEAIRLHLDKMIERRIGVHI